MSTDFLELAAGALGPPQARKFLGFSAHFTRICTHFSPRAVCTLERAIGIRIACTAQLRLMVGARSRHSTHSLPTVKLRDKATLEIWI